MQEEVKRPLGDELLFGALENGGHVVIDVESGAGVKKLAFRFEGRKG
jgi:ATP-dependent Clp protease ATP-binding subunit ClpA